MRLEWKEDHFLMVPETNLDHQALGEFEQHRDDVMVRVNADDRRAEVTIYLPLFVPVLEDDEGVEP